MPKRNVTEKLVATLKSLKFGIELEFVGASKEAMARAVQSVVGGTCLADYRGWRVVDSRSRTWQVVFDGSLSGGDYGSGEVVSPVLGYEDVEELQRVVRAVRQAGGRADSSCGIHVHVDGSRFDGRSLTNLARLVARNERLLTLALSVSETRLERYCKPVDAAFLARLDARKPRTLQDVQAAWYGSRDYLPRRYDSSRYHGLNLNSFFFRGTVEFRYFNGSTHAGEVKSYVQLVLALAASALEAKSVTGRARPFDAAVAKYDVRTLALRLGLVGDEFETVRHHLTKRLSGASATRTAAPTRLAA